MIEITADMITETKRKICDEFIGKFHEFIADVTNLISGEMTEFNFGKSMVLLLEHRKLQRNILRKTLPISHFSRRMFSVEGILRVGKIPDIISV